MITILVDADACPVKDEIRRVAGDCGAHVVFVAALQHAPREAFESGMINGDASAESEEGGDEKAPGVEYVIVERHQEAVDIAIMNRTRPGDIVVTQDFGLAAVVVQKGARALSPEGRLYKADDLEMLLERRHQTRELRRQKGGVRKLSRKAPFTNEAREKFERQMRKLLICG